MIDSLLGLVMLMLLTGWMAGVVSVQAMLSSSARSLSTREQVDVLAAVKASSMASASASDRCDALLADARADTVMHLLQELLLAPPLMARKNDQPVEQFMADRAAEGELPYANSDDFGKLIGFDQAGSQDWLIQANQSAAGGTNQGERLFLCS
jgi:hypothetical protein